MDKRLCEFLGNEKIPIAEDVELYVSPITMRGIMYVEHVTGKSFLTMSREMEQATKDGGFPDIKFAEVQRILAALVIQHDSKEAQQTYMDPKVLNKRLNSVRSELMDVMKPNLLRRYLAMLMACFQVEATPEQLRGFIKAVGLVVADGPTEDKNPSKTKTKESNGQDSATPSAKNTAGQ